MTEGLIFGKSIIGYALEDGWIVKEFLNKTEDETGGSYSLSYKVERDGEEGFMKVYDLQTYRDKRNEEDDADIQFLMLKHYRYERDLHKICRTGFFDKVCYAIGAGTIRIEVSEFATQPVYYLIFQKAESDMHTKIYNPVLMNLNHGWKFRMLHDIAVGMKQLHSKQIYHQDIKPSNILCFPEEDYKVGDLGRSYTTTQECPFSSEPYWGDKRYMAPEISYNNPPANLVFRAQMTDLFLFGSLIYQTFTGECYNASLYKNLDITLHPCDSVSYLQALPVLKETHIKIINDFGNDISYPELIRSRLVDCVKQLCEPDYRNRHHPEFKNADYNHMQNLEKLISTFDYLDSRYKISKN